MFKRFPFWLSVFCAFALAENPVWNFPVSADSEELRAAFRTLSEPEKISGSFRQVRTVVKINRFFESTGTFEISREGGIVWNVERPFASKMVVTDSSVLQIDADGNGSVVASRDNAVFDEISRTMRAVFLGNSDALRERFEIYFVRNKRKGSWNVGLIPRETVVRSVIRSIELEGSKNLKKVVLVDGEGNKLVYEFGQFGK